MAKHLNCLYGGRAQDGRPSFKHMQPNKQTQQLSMRAPENIPFYRCEAAVLAHIEGDQKTASGTHRLTKTPSRNADEVTGDSSPWPSNGPDDPQKPAVHGSLDGSFGMIFADMLTNQSLPHSGLSSGLTYPPQQSNIIYPEKYATLGSSSDDVNVAASQFDVDSGLAQNPAHIADGKDHQVVEHTHQKLDLSLALPLIRNNDIPAYHGVAYNVLPTNATPDQVHKLSCYGSFPKSCLLHSDEGVNNSATEGISALLARDSVPNDLYIGRPTYLAPIDCHLHDSDSRLESKTVLKEYLSKKIYAQIQEEPTETLQSSADNSHNSLIQQVPDIDLHGERIQRAEVSLAANIPHNALEVGHAVQEKIDEVEEEFGPGFLRPFRPSYSVLRSMGILDDIRTTVLQPNHNCSNNYRGDVTISRNRSAEILEDENCAVFMLGLPSHITHTELLGSLRNSGQIYATVINPPTGRIQTSAAKIIFFERSQAEKLMKRVLGERNFMVMGWYIQDIRWNKIKSARYRHPTHSRVIRITGRKELMDFDFFESFFKTRFTYELESRHRVFCADPEMDIHEWRFGSLRCQAASAKTAIERELHGVFNVEWAKDPCA